jgi:UDP:flavonoid glycosyltransferase YjiC (YdhE family)
VPSGPLLRRVAAVVSPAGNGIVVRAAAAGVPVLLLPDGKDQFDVTRGAEAAGLGIVLDRTRLDAAETRRALRALLDEPGYRTRARELARRAATYDAARTAADAIERALRSAS